MNTISPSTSSMTTYIQTYTLCEYLRQNNFDASKAFRAPRLTYIHKCLKDERSDLRYCMLWASGDFTEVANMETIQIWFVVNSMLRVPCVGVVQCVHTIHSTNKGNPWCGGHYPHHRGSSATRWSIMWNLNHSGLLLWFFFLAWVGCGACNYSSTSRTDHTYTIRLAYLNDQCFRHKCWPAHYATLVWFVVNSTQCV